MSKTVTLKFSLCVYVCVFMGVTMWGVLNTLYIQNKKDRNTKFHTQYHISVQIILPCSCENRKTENGVGESEVIISKTDKV